MKRLERRITRLEKSLPVRPCITDRQGSDGVAEVAVEYNRVAERLRLELVERGQTDVVRRVLDGGSELERLALLARLGHCPHTIMLLAAMDRGDATNELLIWWRKTAPLILRRLLGEEIPPIAPFVFHSPEFPAGISNVEALRIFERLRANLKRAYPTPRAR